MQHSLKKRYGIKLLSSIINGIVGTILIAIIPKALSPIAYGQFIYLQNFFSKIISFLDMGSSIAFFTKLSANNKRKELIIFYLLYSLTLLFLLLISIFTIDKLGYMKTILPNIPNQYIYFGLFFGFFTWLTQIFIKISDAYILTVSVELIKIIHKIVSLLMLFYLVYYNNFTLTTYFFFHYISLISFLIILTLLFIKKDIFKNFQFSIFNSQFSILVKEFIKYCHPLLIYSIINILVGIFDIWLLQKVSGSKEMGFYGLSYSLSAMCFLFTSAMTPIITREFAKSYEDKNIENMKKLFLKYIPMLYSISAYFAIFISIQSQNILTIFTDNEFKDAYLVLMIMAFYPIHQTYGQLSGSIFYATGETKLLRNISLFTQPLGLILSFLFIYLFNLGAIGLASKMIIIQFIGVNIQLYFNSKFLGFNIKYFLWHQIYAILFFIIIAFISSNFISINSPIINFLVSGLIYTILVIIFTSIFPQIFAVTQDEINKSYIKIYNKLKGK